MMTEVPPNSILRCENISSPAGTFLPAMGFGCTPGDIPLYARRALTQRRLARGGFLFAQNLQHAAVTSKIRAAEACLKALVIRLKV